MARLSSYPQDSNISPEDRLVGSSYEGEGQNGPIYKTRTYRLGELGNFVSGYVGDVNVTDSPEFISLSETVTNNTTAIASANQSITTINNELLAQATFQTNLAASFGTYDENGNITSFSEATANQILQVTTSDRFAESVFVTNLAASVGTYDANGNLITLGQAFADQVLSATASDRFAEASFVTNLASSFGTYNPDGSIATLSEAFANQVVSTSTTGDYANAQFVTTLLSNFGTYDENGALVSVSESYANQLLGTANTSDFAQASYVTNLGASFGTLNPDGSVAFDNNSTYANSIINYVDSSSALATQVENLQTTVTNIPQTIRQDEPPDVNAYPLGSIWVDTNDGNAIYILIDGTPRTWEPTTSEALGDLILSNAQLQTEIDLLSTNVSAQALKTTTLTAQFGVYDPATNTFTINNNANVISALRTYADAESAAASKVDGINSVLNMVDASGNVIKNLATFNQEITTYVDANSATASKVESIGSEFGSFDPVTNTFTVSTAKLETIVDTLTLNNYASASSVETLTSTIGDENSGLVAQVNTASTTVADLENGLQASYGLTVQTGTGAISSITLLAEDPLQPGLPPTSSIVFNTGAFKIQNGSGVDQFTIDTNTGKAVFSGTLQAANGTFTGTVQAGLVNITSNNISLNASSGYSSTGSINFNNDRGNTYGSITTSLVTIGPTSLAGLTFDSDWALDFNTNFTRFACGSFQVNGSSLISLESAGTVNITGGSNVLSISSSGLLYNGSPISAGSVDLSNYYTKTEVNNNFAALGVAVTFSNTVTATDFILSSDATLKENIKDYTVKPINIQYKEYNLIGDDKQRVGVIAQELEKDHPEFVKITDNGTKAVSYIDMLVAKVAELEQRIKQLENGAAS